MTKIIILTVVLALCFVCLVGVVAAGHPGKGNEKTCCYECPCTYYPGEHKGWAKIAEKGIGWAK